MTIDYSDIANLLSEWEEFDGDDVSVFVQSWTDKLNGTPVSAARIADDYYAEGAKSGYIHHDNDGFISADPEGFKNVLREIVRIARA